MTTLPPTPSGVVRISHNIAGITFRWEIAYTAGPPSTADLSTIAGEARSLFSAHLASLVASGVSLVETKAYDLANPSTPAGVDTTAVAGSRSGTIAPLQVTALLNFGIDRRYRGSKPKIWAPFGVEGDFANAYSWDTTLTNAVNAGWSAYSSALSGFTAGTTVLGSQVCVSYYSGKELNPGSGNRKYVPTPRGTPAVFAITSVSCRQVFGSQRRRR